MPDHPARPVWSVLKIDAERRGAESPDEEAVRGVDLRKTR